MAYQAPYSGLASLMEMQGRGPDTRLVHMTPMELRTLQAMSPTGRLTTNPETGLPEAGILEDILPIALPIAGSFLFPMAAPALFGASSALATPAIASAIGTGLGSAASGLVQGKGLGDSLIQGGLSGLMSYGLGSLSSAFAPSGGVTATPAQDFSVADQLATGSTFDPMMEATAGLSATDVAGMSGESPGFFGRLGEQLSTPIAPETLGGATYGSALGAGGSGLLAAGLLEEPYQVADMEMMEDYYPYYDADLEGGRERGRAAARRLNMPPSYASSGDFYRMASSPSGLGTFLAADGGRVPKNLNINGQPHELSYINEDEANLLRSLGGAGQNVMGIPAYFDAGEGTAGEGAADDGSGVGAAADGSDSAPGADMGVGGYSDAQAAAVTDAMSTMSDMESVGMDPMGVVGNVNDPSQAATMGVGASQNAPTAITAPPPNIGFLGRAALGLFGLTPKGFTVNPDMTYQSHMGIGMPGLSNAAMSAMGMDTSLGTISSQTMSPGGGDVGDDDDGTDGGGDINYRRPYGDPYNTGGTA